jgi:methyl-accepting chemotaxis protein
MDEVAQRDDVKTAIAGFSSQVETYREGFNAISELQGRRNEVVFGTLDKLGPQLQEDIAAITKELQSVFKTGAAFSSARVQYAVANMRLSGNKYLLSNDQEAYSKAKEYVDLAQSELVKVIGEADYPPLAEAFEKAGADIATYAAAISEVHEIISQRNDIITGTLDVVGPALSDSVEELKLSLKERQDTLGPSIESTMANGVVSPASWRVAALSVAGLRHPDRHRHHPPGPGHHPGDECSG